MFCTVTVVRVYVLYCDSGTRICFVLCQWHLYMFCTVTMVMYMFCTVTVLSVHVLCCDSGTCICFVF